jgi:lipoprotein-anchoring transpeptidase ErfK/SrfK
MSLSAVGTALGLGMLSGEPQDPSQLELGADPDEFESSPALPVVLPAPSLAEWEGAPSDARSPGRAATMALAFHYDTPVFNQPGKRPRPAGVVRRGTRLPVASRAQGAGCNKGSWYALVGGGFACSSIGFNVSTKPIPFDVRQRPPDLSSPLPFVYGEVKNPQALRFHRVPTADEEARIAEVLAQEGSKFPDVVAERLQGDYFVAIDREERDGERRFYRTVRGRYVRVEDVALQPESEMHGEHLSGARSLPLAFVFGDDALAHKLEKGRLAAAGIARKHSRFRVARTATRKAGAAEKRWVVSPEGLHVARDRVRIARTVKRPNGIPAGTRWVHVDLSEQTLIAYQDDQPVFATLVSSGREDGYATPRGLFRVRAKHVSTTMRGQDPVDGIYDVEEVPWTLFYWEGYALHGAYWHNDFGKPRSHGCTNLAPADARWLFHWVSPRVPAGWHAVTHATGTWIYLTRSASGTRA